jgi:flagellar protein FliO/FliZ
MLAVRVVFSLAVVLLMMWGLSRVLAGRGGNVRASNLEIVSRTTLGKRAAVVVVRNGERGLILGVTDQSVSLLGETDLPALPVAAERRTPVELTPDLMPEGSLVAVPDLEAAPEGRARHRAARTTATAGGIGGSVLSPATWRQTAEALRERTARS